LLFVFAETGAAITAFGRLEVNLFLPKMRDGKSHFGYPSFCCIRDLEISHSQPFAAAYIYPETRQDPMEPVLLMAVKIMLQAKLCLSVI
jgi:hypothetical protein